MDLIALGTVIQYGGQSWTVSMVGLTGGERYYWLTRPNEFAMVPAFMLPQPPHTVQEG